MASRLWSEHVAAPASLASQPSGKAAEAAVEQPVLLESQNVDKETRIVKENAGVLGMSKLEAGSPMKPANQVWCTPVPEQFS
jgi:hypothetical protein